MTDIHIDFETFSRANLKDVGAWMYARHDSTKVLCMGWAVDDEEPVIWMPEYPAPTRLFRLIKEGATLNAWNSFFEWCIWTHVLKWPDVHLSQWDDIMARAASYALPLSLDQCGRALKLDVVKDDRGKFLIDKLCKPQRGGFQLHDNALLAELYEYCRQDVRSERHIAKRLPKLPSSERTLWQLDQRINIRGISVDTDMATCALGILDDAVALLNEEVQEVTSGRLHSTNSRQQVFQYFDDEFGFAMDSYAKNDVIKALKDDDTPDGVKDVLRIRQQEGKTSTKKYKKLIAITDDDGRAHGLLQFHAASTGRWGGRLFQPHNLPRPAPHLEGMSDAIIDLFSMLDPAAFRLFGEPMDCMSSALRGMLIADENKRLYVGDYKQIEARALAWLAQQLDKLAVFAEGEDVYKHAAANMFNKPLTEVTKEDRFSGKISELALGYQGGERAIESMAEDYGAEFELDFREEIKTLWRANNQDIVSYWYALESAACAAVIHKREFVVDSGLGNVSFDMGRHWLHCILPSGRHLYYFHPTVVDGQLKYWGVDSYTKKWSQLSMYGGKYAQHICEGVCRDLLAFSMINIEEAGFDMVLSVHDENIAEHDVGWETEFTDLMLKTPNWTAGLPVDVDVFTAKRYRK